MDKCKKCGSIDFEALGSIRFEFELQGNGTLLEKLSEDLGLDGVFVCVECGQEYSASEFREILTI